MCEPFDQRAVMGDATKFTPYPTAPIIVGIGEIIVPKGFEDNFVEVLLDLL